MEFFLNVAELSFIDFGGFSESRESDKFKDPVPHTCLAATVVASWSLMQEVAGRALLMTNIFLVTEFAKFSENIYRKNSSAR